MIIEKGTPVMAINPDFLDEYEGILSENWDTMKPINALVCIQCMRRYPMQTAVIFRDIAYDCAPLLEGKCYRLKVTAIRTNESPTLTYSDSVEIARRSMIHFYERVGREDCLTNLRRHELGEYTSHRRHET